jgi:hypothetical protein
MVYRRRLGDDDLRLRPGTLAVAARGNAGFDFGNGAIDYLDGAAAMAAFVVLRSLQSRPCIPQMRERGPHVGLIGPN